MAEAEVGAVAPVENVPATQAVPAPETPVNQESEQQPVQPRTYSEDEHKELVAKAVSERLSKERRRLDRVARAEAEAAFYKQQFEATQRREQPREDQEPQESDFEGKPYREFVAAHTRWQVRQELKTERERQSRESQQTHDTQRQTQQAQYVHERLISKGQEKFRDFDEKVLADDVPISPAMVAAATRLENGAEVLYHLAGNESELMRLVRLSDIEQAWELRDLSKKLSAPPKPTQTPPPIVPNGQKANVDKRLEDANIDEFFAIRKRQIAAKKGR